MTRLTLAFVALISANLMIPASAQQPAPAQVDAIKSNCRSDFMSKCRGVTPGGAEALQCLKQNHASLSGGCKTAVGAIMPAAAPPPAAAKPAPAPAAAAPAPAAPQPATAAAPPAPKPATPATAAAPAAPKPATAAPAPAKPSAAKPAPASKPAVAAAPPAAAPAPATPAPPLSAAARRLTLKDVARIRRFCFEDIGLHCKHIPAGQNRILDCLAAQEPSLIPACKQAVVSARQ